MAMVRYIFIEMFLFLWTNCLNVHKIFRSWYSNEKRKKKKQFLWTITWKFYENCNNIWEKSLDTRSIRGWNASILPPRYHYREREANKSNEVIPRIATALLRTTSNKSYLCAADTSCCNYRYRVTTRWSRFELSHRSFRKQSICHYEPRSLIHHRRMNNAWSRWKTSVFS